MCNTIATFSVPKDPAERRVWICVQLQRKGTSLRRLAAKAGVSHQAMSAALLRPSSHLEQALAAAIGLRPMELFPERFDLWGRRLVSTRQPQRIMEREPGRHAPLDLRSHDLDLRGNQFPC